MRKLQFVFISVLTAIAFISCKTGSVNLFKAASPHEQYKRKLETAGLDKTAMGLAWINAAESSIQKALNITIPYQETGYFDAGKIPAASYRFSATKGQKITISVSKKPAQSALYLDLWHLDDVNNPKRIASADTLNNPIQYEINDTGSYLIRLQPELLQSVAYTLEITTGPSLAFPTQSKSKSIGSFWGDGRDNNARKHEGVDIFGARRSPVIASANGTITRVNENNLGGKVVWLRPAGKDYTLYYAHLDEQVAREGQEVKIGDTIGLMGNTGNAKTTATHLHFGIYTSGGAVNPLPYINPISKAPVNINANLDNLNKTLRTSSKENLYGSPENKSAIVSTLTSGTIINVNSATGNFYKVALPDGNTGFINSKELVQTTKPLQKLKIKSQQEKVYDQPDSLAAVKINLRAGQTVYVLGTFKNYQLISDENAQVGWIVK
ncbi:peptidoglycan DD-metalloendopeptidase family protein [Pedobacter petrophilus]|uniref:Peptidoglycan DD-metalloendopeptidase family protein n=1 Tax=Pedobacter petrophilus TaxID=1908241 RepID=A0A7K0G3H1_9SPHI|nr:peptidoglycan DD-metalloendopeptidase family protein [Pedobacter petrophilus]MRX78355.1 peptidoglycan DD-metalloendopeptidase family protein [Pedobacter petrophilus]